MSETILDMTKGVYRRQYAGFLRGKRINAVSWMAEAWFWRLQALADDHGNLHGDPRGLATEAAPKREVSAKQAQALTDELVAIGLIQRYEARGDEYLHIVGFTDLQPAGKNGRRIQRVPMNPGESKAIQGSPVPPITKTNTTPRTIPNEECAVSAAKPAVPAAVPVRDIINAAANCWGKPYYGILFDHKAVTFVWLREERAEHIDRWRAAYPAVDIEQEIRRAAEWCAANPTNGRKSNYRKFLTDWMSRTQDRGGTRNGHHPQVVISNADRRRAEKRAAEFDEPASPIPIFGARKAHG